MTRISIWPLLALIPATPVFSQDLSPPETAVLPRIIDSLCHDIIPDRTGCETAVLLTSDDEPDAADLVVFTDRRDGEDGAVEIIALARGLTFNGAMWGMSPSLEAIGSSLLVRSEQIGIGRTPWEQTLTLAWRDGALRVAGFTYSARDRLNTAYMICDVNLLTGDWETETGFGALDDPPETDRGRGDAGALAVAAWGDTASAPAACDAVFARFADLSDQAIPE